jgi:hypothetical protein
MITDKYILGDDGEPQAEPNLLKWATWLENSMPQRRLALTEMENGGRVSTVFLGIDHDFTMRIQWETIQWTQEGEKIAAEFQIPYQPLIWETMVFDVDGEMDRHMERYRTRAEALRGHARIVEEASKAPARKVESE